MKQLILTLLFCGLVSHAFSFSLEESNPVNDRVDAFREEIFYRFNRLNSFYSQKNFEMRTIRLRYVNTISETYDKIMELFGNELDFVRRASVELDEVIADMTTRLGSSNACLQRVIADRNSEAIRVDNSVRGCSIRANTTMWVLLRDVFYPELANAQTTISTVPLMVMNALARGNVMGDEQEILDYLESQYNFITTLWPTGIVQQLTWEVARFMVESEFYIDEMFDCLVTPVYIYIRDTARLIYEAEMCH